jgi:hypothetical protein
MAAYVCALVPVLPVIPDMYHRLDSGIRGVFAQEWGPGTFVPVQGHDLISYLTAVPCPLYCRRGLHVTTNLRIQ